MMADQTKKAQTLVIGPTETWWLPSLREAWAAKGLLTFFLWKDVRVRYKQTFMGLLWAMLQPLLEMLIFTIVFGPVYGKTVSGVPYHLFVFAGLLPWTYVTSTVTSGTQSLVAHAEIVKRIYFPRFLLPVATAISKMIDFFVAFILLIILIAFYGIAIGKSILLLPLVFVLLMIAASGAALWLSTLNALYRDVGLILPYFLRLSMFITPIVYPLHELPPVIQKIMWMNPLTSAVELFRVALLPEMHIDWVLVSIGGACSLILFFSGLFFFRRMEERILDVL